VLNQSVQRLDTTLPACTAAAPIKGRICQASAAGTCLVASVMVTNVSVYVQGRGRMVCVYYECACLYEIVCVCVFVCVSVCLLAAGP
jgi:hypothetical protein